MIPQKTAVSLLSIVGLFLFSCSSDEKAPNPNLPNIIYILADDLGYGDVSALNPDSKIQTTHIDKLASQGMVFTDAHSPSSVCTPTRYSILTGQYSWRTNLKRGVLLGYGPPLIEKEKITVAELLKRKGYRTGVVGKWHLGVEWALRPGLEQAEVMKASTQEGRSFPINIDTSYLDLTKPVNDGPNTHGFDYSFILPASLDFEPYCYLENQQLVSPLDSTTEGNDLNTGYTEAFWRPGKMASDFEFDQVLPTFIDKAGAFLEESANQESPFFLYLPLAAPHTPWVPTQEYSGTAQAGTYGDFVKMVDDQVGKLLAKLAGLGLEENTLIVFTSDNGPFWRETSIEQFDHRAAHHFKGMKADVWEGGHRIPFIVRWPDKIPSGSRSGQLMSLTDWMATCAAVVNEPLGEKEGEDSFNMLPAMLGNAIDKAIRPSVICHSSRGHFVVRQGKWKFIPKRGSGGFTQPATVEPAPGEPSGQLYDLETDIAEQHNLYLKQPEKVTELSSLLDRIKLSGGERKMYE